MQNFINVHSYFKQLVTPFVCIDLELIDSKLIFNPPLDESSHIKNLQEILFDFINTFISRGSYMQVLGKNRVNSLNYFRTKYISVIFNFLVFN